MAQKHSSSTSFEARTSSFTTREPSRVALEARELRRIDRIENASERRAAFSVLMSDFPPVIGSY